MRVVMVAAALACLARALPVCGAPGRNLLANPGFENRLSGWMTGNSWYDQPAGSGSSLAEPVSDITHSGSGSLRVTGKSNRGIVMQAFAVRPGRYLLSGWVRTRGMGSANAALLAEWLDAKQKWLAGTPLPAVGGDSDWTRVEGEVVAPPDARFVHVDLLTNTANSGSAWFDDITFARAEATIDPPSAVGFTVESPPFSSGRVRLEWTGHKPEQDVIAYRIYRSDRPFTSTAGMDPALTVTADQQSADLGGLANGKPVYVAVVAANMEGMARADVACREVTPQDRKAPAEPTVLCHPVASAAGGALYLTWRSPAEADLAGFTVQVGKATRKLTPHARAVLLTHLPAGSLSVQVEAVDRSGNTSGSGSSVEIAGPGRTGRWPLQGLVRSGGAAAAGVRVEVRRSGALVASATTGPSGAYHLASVAAGLCTVQAVRPSGLAGPRIFALIGGGTVTADLELPAAGPWQAWSVAATDNLFRDAVQPAGATRTISLVALANQKRSAQVAIRPATDLLLTGVRFEPLVAADSKRALQPAGCTASFVSYVALKANSTAMPPEELLRKAPAEFPDELSDDAEREVKAGQVQPIFLTFDVPRGTPAGHYAGRCVVTSNLGEQAFDVRIEVLPVTFPDKTRLFVVNWLDWGALCRKHGVEPWTDGFYEVARIYTRLMREHHQNVVVLPPELCDIVVEPDKRITFDWTRFDRAARFFVAEGVGERLCIGHLGGRTTGEWECPTFSLNPRPATVRGTGEATTVTPEAFAAALQDHMEKMGWLDRTLQHIGDEPIPVNVASYREQSARIGRAAPKLRRIDAIHVPDLKGSLEVWVPELEYFDQWLQGYRQFQKAGQAEMWFYIAWVPQGKYPQRLIDTQAIKARTIHWMNYLWDTTGYLHWALEWWDIDVESLAPGDSRIIWPGKDGPNSSLRYEAQREGLEDCEMLAMLEREQARVAATLGVRGFDCKARPKELGHTVVRTFTDYTRSYRDLEEIRAQVGREIAALQHGLPLLTRVDRPCSTPVEPGPVVVEGWTQPGAEVQVNDKRLASPQGHFKTTVAISADRPSVTVTAAHGGRATTVLRLYTVK